MNPPFSNPSSAFQKLLNLYLGAVFIILWTCALLICNLIGAAYVLITAPLLAYCEADAFVWKICDRLFGLSDRLVSLFVNGWS